MQALAHALQLWHAMQAVCACREFLQEEKENQVLYRNTFGTQRSGGALRNAFDLKLKNPANTNVLSWGNRLLALWEVCFLFFHWGEHLVPGTAVWLTRISAACRALCSCT